MILLTIILITGEFVKAMNSVCQHFATQQMIKKTRISTASGTIKIITVIIILTVMALCFVKNWQHGLISVNVSLLKSWMNYASMTTHVKLTCSAGTLLKMTQRMELKDVLRDGLNQKTMSLDGGLHWIRSWLIKSTMVYNVVQVLLINKQGPMLLFVHECRRSFKMDYPWAPLMTVIQMTTQNLVSCIIPVLNLLRLPVDALLMVKQDTAETLLALQNTKSLLSNFLDFTQIHSATLLTDLTWSLIENLVVSKRQKKSGKTLTTIGLTLLTGRT